MQPMGFRQEVLNVKLAELLAQRGLVALPEQRLPEALPDVLVIFRGLRLNIEGEIGDQVGAEQRAWGKASERVQRDIAHIAVALLYPAYLRHEPLENLTRAIEGATLKFAVCIPPIPEKPNWLEGDIDALCHVLQTAYERLASEDAVQKAASLLREAIQFPSLEMITANVSVDSVAYPLGIPPESVSKQKSRQMTSIAQIASLVLANAMLFQEELAQVDHRIKRLPQCLEAKNFADELLEVWRFILHEINYHAVFDIARKVLLELPNTPQMDSALRHCAEKVLEVAKMRVATRHDVAGRLYHLLLGDIAKPLGTYYTSVPAATLLLRLAFDPNRWQIAWQNINDVGKLKVADFACGTGTLLMAALQSILDNFLRVAWRNGEDLPTQRRKLLKVLLEEGIWGMDVLQSAVHLTATALTLPIPEVTVKGMNLYALDLGVRGDEKRLGSLDLLRGTAQVTVALRPVPVARAKGKRVTETRRQQVSLQLPEGGFDLICMNPPFTRSTGGNLLFGSLQPKERKALQSELQRLIQSEQLLASATAGLASVFVALADRHLKENGRLALVLPKALLSGVEWERTRKLLMKRYVVEFVITSHDPHRWNFSDNTDLSEVLIVARKLAENERPKNNASSKHNPCLPLDDESSMLDKTVFVNLWRNPRNSTEAFFVAEPIRRHEVPHIDKGAAHLWVGDEKFGEAFALEWDEFRQLEHWLLPVAYAQRDLVRQLLSLRIQSNLPLCPLKELGELGPQRRDVWDAFEPVDAPPGYPAFWGHDASRMTTMKQEPNAYLLPLGVPRKGRPLRDAKLLWSRAGRVLVAERMRLNTQRLPAILMSEPVLSNVWWPFQLREGLGDDAEKVIVLWLNSTMGIFNLVANRVETQGAWVTFKKPTLHSMPVLDVRKLTKRQRQKLVQAFDELADKPLLPLSQIADDPIRKAIDDAVCAAFGLPDLKPLRSALSREPVFTLRPLKQRRISK
ncbi:MAG: hypothetical protein N3B10_03990 [Armatimonadetes bacterium]|nr:hypothetical protein [Armatimonadota bacterium]